MERFPSSLDDAIAEYEQRKSVRYVEELKLQKAKELMKAEEWIEALRILRPLWQTMTYRTEGWWDIVEDVGWSLRTVAAHAGDGESVIAADWELMNNTFASRSGWPYDLSKALDGLNMKSKPALTIREQDVHSFLSSSFAFEQPEGKVADVCTCQLTITSHASKVAAPVTISNIKIVFEGGLKPITINHLQGVDGDRAVYAKVALSEATGSTPIHTGKQDLTFAPGQSKVLELSFPLREPGQARAVSSTFSIESATFELDYIVDFDQVIIPDTWWHQKSAKKRLVRIDPYLINILPKPPKMDVKFVELHEQYYTNEAINLRLEILNGEDEDSMGKLHVYVANEQGPQIHLSLDEKAEGETDSSEEPEPEISLGTVAASKSTFINVKIPPSEISSAYDLIVDLSYNLVSDPETPISRTMTIRLFVVSPFEANYDFSPRFDPTPWPSFFTHTEGEQADGHVSDISTEKAAGIPQRWCLTSLYASFAVTSLLVTNVDITTLAVNGGISCKSMALPGTGPSESTPIRMEPNASEESNFTVITQKLSLDDRRSASLDLALSISWRRTPDSPINTTLLPVPRLLVASQEPRVLLSYEPHPSSTPLAPIMNLTYTIENPSMHFLTFAMVMNPSEDFAFSGLKSGTVQLVPLSRRSVQFILLPNPSVRGQWIRPVFVVRDRYFQKLLRVSPGQGCRVDKEGVSILVPTVEEEDDQ